MTLIIACGLKKEVRLIDRPGRDVLVIAGGGDSLGLASELDDTALLAPGIILSCGIAGALDPGLRTGDVVIDGDDAVVRELFRALPRARIAGITGGDAIVATATEKRVLALRTGAAAADMESHVARLVAAQRGLPFAALRVISDQVEDDLPPAALAGMRPDGGMALGAVLASIVKEPGQLPALLRTGRQAGAAFRALAGAFDAVIAAGIDRIDPADLMPD